MFELLGVVPWWRARRSWFDLITLTKGFDICVLLCNNTVSTTIDILVLGASAIGFLQKIFSPSLPPSPPSSMCAFSQSLHLDVCLHYILLIYVSSNLIFRYDRIPHIYTARNSSTQTSWWTGWQSQGLTVCNMAVKCG